MTLGDAIREYRLEHRMSQRQFAEKCGLSNGYIAMVERGVNPATEKPIVPSIEKCKAIANAMGLTLDAMLRTIDNTDVLVNDFGSGYTDIEKLPRNVTHITQLRRQRIPLIGKVAAGEPIYSPEDYDAYVDSPVKCDVAIQVQGDSMVPKFEDGDTVYVRCQPDVGDGQIAVVFLDDEAVIKRVYHEKEGLTLLSDNPAYGPIRATFDEYNVIRIFGIPVGLTRMFKPDLSNKIRKGFK